MAPAVNDLTPGTAHQAMLMVGVVEIAAGLLVAVRPHVGGYVVAAWLAGIILNLLLIGGFYDVALRNFGLFVAALALARLASTFRSPTGRRPGARPGLTAPSLPDSGLDTERRMAMCKECGCETTTSTEKCAEK